MADIVPASVPVHPTSSQIPVDLFVSKKHPGLPRGELGFLDSSGDTVYKVTHQSVKTSSHKRVLLDAAGNPLFSLRRKDHGSWEGYKGGDSEEKDLKLRVKRTKNKLTRTELEVFLAGENSADSACDFQVKGFPFQKSCTIYRGNEIVAQTSLMYKLHQLMPKRGKFRLTIFPGPVDHALNGALSEAIKIWKRNFDKEFEGGRSALFVTASSILQTTALPRPACMTCKHKFHYACLFKCFSTSHKSTCPIGGFCLTR